MGGTCDSTTHFELVSRGHQFVLDVLPFRDPDSQLALKTFLDHVSACRLPSPLIDGVLLRCLTILDRHTGGRLPGLVERYISEPGVSGGAPCSAPEAFQQMARFRIVVEDLLKYRGITNPLVADAIAEIDVHYADPELRKKLPGTLGVTPRALAEAFKSATGLTEEQYVRSVRLSHAARLLVETHEHKIWGMVGYNAGSVANFNHDFKRQYGMTPGEYRRRTLASTLGHGVAVAHLLRNGAAPRPGAELAGARPSRPRRERLLERPTRVLVIEDDQRCVEITSRFLRASRYVVATASSGEEGLREAASITPDVVLLDHCLGDGMTGLDCLQALRRQGHVRPPAAVLITADWEVADDDVRRLEAFLIHKPCDLDRIHDTIIYLSAPNSRHLAPAERERERESARARLIANPSRLDVSRDDGSAAARRSLSRAVPRTNGASSCAFRSSPREAASAPRAARSAAVPHGRHAS